MNEKFILVLNYQLSVSVSAFSSIFRTISTKSTSVVQFHAASAIFYYELDWIIDPMNKILMLVIISIASLIGT